MKSFPFPATASAKRHAPATARNRDAILDVLREELVDGKVLEIASGTGEHAVHFARNLPSVQWQPSDPSLDALASIAAHAHDAGLQNLLAPCELDVHSDDWLAKPEGLTAIVCINMVHIAPWSAAVALFAGAARCLPVDGSLILYGPYRFHGAFTASSNEAFDARLRSEDPSWGVRDVDDLDGEASRFGFRRERTLALPANNHVLVYRRRG